MKHQRVTLVLYGIETYLGREVARFGRAMGHRMVAVVDAVPEFDAPWMHGIHWAPPQSQTIDDRLQGPPKAILYCDTTLWDGGRGRFRQVLFERPRELIKAAASLQPPPRFVYRSTTTQSLLPAPFTAYCRRTEQEITRCDLPSVILRLPLLYGPDRPDSVAAMMLASALAGIPLSALSRHAPKTLRVETAALATLRAALEPDIAGILEPDDVSSIGDVMIPQ